MSWETVMMREFLKHRDMRFKPKDSDISGLKRIDKIDFSGNIFISDKPSNTDMILVKKGDLVISGINVEKGAMAVYQGKDDLTATIHYSSYEYDETKIDVEFLKNFLKSEGFVRAIKEQVSGGIKTEIKPKHLLPLKVNIPIKVKDQRRIVTSLQTKNNKIETIGIEQSYQLDLLKKLRQQILKDAMQGKLVPQDPNDEPANKLLIRIREGIEQNKFKKKKTLPDINPEDIPFKIPNNWKWCRLGEVCYKITDGFHSTPKKLSGGEIYISAMHIRENLIKWGDCLYVSAKDHNELYKKASPKKGEILITNRGAGCGTPAIIDIDTEFSFQNAALIGFNQSLVNNKYVCYFLLMSRKEIMDNFVNGGLQPMLSNVLLGTLPVPLPPTREQERIAKKIEQLMILCDELEQSIKRNQKHTQDLLRVALKEALEPAN